MINQHRAHKCSCRMPIFGKEDHCFAASGRAALPEIRDEALVVIYCAKKIITMDPMQPTAEAVAVQNGKIYAVGSLKNITHGLKLAGREFYIDKQFSEQVILPGFIEAHCHPLPTGLFWQWIYIGADVRLDPNGNQQGGYRSKTTALNALREQASGNSKEPILAWGYDPAVLSGFPVLSRQDLDAVSDIRPVVVINMSGHIMYGNSVVLQAAGFDAATTIQGVVKDAVGNPTGELQEVAAMLPVLSIYTKFDRAILLQAMENVARIAQRAGCTTIADLALGFIPGGWGAMQEVANQSNYPVRLAAYVLNDVFSKYGGVNAFTKVVAANNDRLRLTGVKFVTDGSIQGYTANLKWPYYYNGKANGLTNIAQTRLVEQLLELHQAGIQSAIHVNGDGAIENALAAIEYVLKRTPRFDHRLRLEHCQTVTEEQLEKMAALGVCANLFVNHIYYWGDFHSEFSLGPERAAKMNPLATVAKHNIRFALHSDSHVTPINPLFTVWIAAKRETAKGKTLGKDERLAVATALRAVTIDAAYLLNEDKIKGSIEPDKFADFVVLAEDPLAVTVDQVKEIKVIATLMNGEVFPV